MVLNLTQNSKNDGTEFNTEFNANIVTDPEAFD